MQSQLSSPHVHFSEGNPESHSPRWPFVAAAKSLGLTQAGGPRSGRAGGTGLSVQGFGARNNQQAQSSQCTRVAGLLWSLPSPAEQIRGVPRGTAESSRYQMSETLALPVLGAEGTCLDFLAFRLISFRIQNLRPLLFFHISFILVDENSLHSFNSLFFFSFFIFVFLKSFKFHSQTTPLLQKE